MSSTATPNNKGGLDFDDAPANTELREAIYAIISEDRLPTEKGILTELTELFQAHQQELLSGLLGELPKTQPAFGEQMYPGKHDKDNLRKYGFNECLTQVVSVIQSKIGELNG